MTKSKNLFKAIRISYTKPPLRYLALFSRIGFPGSSSTANLSFAVVRAGFRMLHPMPSAGNTPNITDLPSFFAGHFFTTPWGIRTAKSLALQVAA